MKKIDLKNSTRSGTFDRAIVWHPKAKELIRLFPKEVRSSIGYKLRLLQRGQSLQMPDAKPMSAIGMGVFELRIRSKDGIYRVFYLMKKVDGIYVFHAFQKKTEKTPKEEINLAQKRLQDMEKE